jgi:hypothetical protein
MIVDDVDRDFRHPSTALLQSDIDMMVLRMYHTQTSSITVFIVLGLNNKEVAMLHQISDCIVAVRQPESFD